MSKFFVPGYTLRQFFYSVCCKIYFEQIKQIKMQGKDKKMLCEKCKNKKSTVFFTDSGGINHSLCAACASAHSSVAATNGTPEMLFLPESCINAAPHTPCELYFDISADKVCECCKTSYEEIKMSGQSGCPVCAADILLLISEKRRIPYQIRRKTDRHKEIVALREKLTRALACEDYEGAVQIRDKIRKLESQNKAKEK